MPFANWSESPEPKLSTQRRAEGAVNPEELAKISGFIATP